MFARLKKSGDYQYVQVVHYGAASLVRTRQRPRRRALVSQVRGGGDQRPGAPALLRSGNGCATTWTSCKSSRSRWARKRLPFVRHRSVTQGAPCKPQALRRVPPCGCCNQSGAHESNRVVPKPGVGSVSLSYKRRCIIALSKMGQTLGKLG